MFSIACKSRVLACIAILYAFIVLLALSDDGDRGYMLLWMEIGWNALWHFVLYPIQNLKYFSLQVTEYYSKMSKQVKIKNHFIYFLFKIGNPKLYFAPIDRTYIFVIIG